MGEIPLWKLKQEAREYIAKCDAEHGTGGLTVTLEEAIKHCEEKARGCSKCADEHRQLAEWLHELKVRREMDEWEG